MGSGLLGSRRERHAMEDAAADAIRPQFKNRSDSFYSRASASSDPEEEAGSDQRGGVSTVNILTPQMSALKQLRRVIQREIEPLLSQLLLDDAVTRDQLVRTRISRGEIAFTIED